MREENCEFYKKIFFLAMLFGVHNFVYEDLEDSSDIKKLINELIKKYNKPRILEKIIYSLALILEPDVDTSDDMRHALLQELLAKNCIRNININPESHSFFTVQRLKSGEYLLRYPYNWALLMISRKKDNDIKCIVSFYKQCVFVTGKKPQGRGKPPPPPRNNFSGSLEEIEDENVIAFPSLEEIEDGNVIALSATCGAYLRSAVYNFFVQKPEIACRMYEGHAHITTYNSGSAIKNVSRWYKDKHDQNVWGGEQTAFIVANMLAVPIILCAPTQGNGTSLHLENNKFKGVAFYPYSMRSGIEPICSPEPMYIFNPYGGHFLLGIETTSTNKPHLKIYHDTELQDLSLDRPNAIISKLLNSKGNGHCFYNSVALGIISRILAINNNNNNSNRIKTINTMTFEDFKTLINGQFAKFNFGRDYNITGNINKNTMNQLNLQYKEGIGKILTNPEKDKILLINDLDTIIEEYVKRDSFFTSPDQLHSFLSSNSSEIRSKILDEFLYRGKNNADILAFLESFVNLRTRRIISSARNGRDPMYILNLSKKNENTIKSRKIVKAYFNSRPGDLPKFNTLMSSSNNRGQGNRGAQNNRNARSNIKGTQKQLKNLQRALGSTGDEFNQNLINLPTRPDVRKQLGIMQLNNPSYIDYLIARLTDIHESPNKFNANRRNKADSSIKFLKKLKEKSTKTFLNSITSDTFEEKVFPGNNSGESNQIPSPGPDNNNGNNNRNGNNRLSQLRRKLIEYSLSNKITNEELTELNKITQNNNISTLNKSKLEEHIRIMKDLLSNDEIKKLHKTYGIELRENRFPVFKRLGRKKFLSLSRANLNYIQYNHGGTKRKPVKKSSTKKVRKHQGIVQTGPNKGKLKKGYKYSGKKLKNGLREITKTGF